MALRVGVAGPAANAALTHSLGTHNGDGRLPACFPGPQPTPGGFWVFRLIAGSAGVVARDTVPSVRVASWLRSSGTRLGIVLALVDCEDANDDV